MGWFDKQIRGRMKNDEDVFADSFVQMANLFRKDKLKTVFQADRKLMGKAIGDVLQFYHVKTREIPDKLKNRDEVLEYLLRPSGIMRRNVVLSGEWYKDASGAMLAVRKDGSVAALIPNGVQGYSYRDDDSQKMIAVNRKNAAQFEREAICFYKSFPLRKMKTVDFFKYMFQMIRLKDYASLFLLSLLAAVVGMITPFINQYLYRDVLEYGKIDLLVSTILTLFCVTLAEKMVTAMRDLTNDSVRARVSLSMESAMEMRVLSLPADFFKKYSAGELYDRIHVVKDLCRVLFDVMFSLGLTAVFSLIYIGEIVAYAPKLASAALVVTLFTVLSCCGCVFVQMRVTQKQLAASGKESGFVYALLGGIEKIKNTGSEKRAFAKWAERYNENVKYTYTPPVILKLNTVITLAISLVGTIVMYHYALKSRISIADYMAFNSAYAYVSGAFASLTGMALTAAKINPIMKMLSPILETEPELTTQKEVVNRLYGGIEMSHVSFRYGENLPLVLNDVSLKIRSGEYVAVVGKTGCGKSTLMRLLLGFEKPEKGAIYYDRKDMESMDLKSLRSKIGVVMQNGKLFQGDLYSNISISAPNLTLEQAWEAAEMAGMAEDIRNMPMGMNTLISEGAGGISGGQKQRLMIARAIASKPRILMFDEATSALDNITQKIVSESLDSLKCTRIVIAHRLSTIRHCSRIIVLDGGRIVEDGTYSELVQKNGFFADLVRRQMMTDNVEE